MKFLALAVCAALVGLAAPTQASAQATCDEACKQIQDDEGHHLGYG
jgi:hypothetical protein